MESSKRECHDSANNFTANGFIVENCKESSGNSTVIIKTGSSAFFENIRISNNNNRAIYVESQSIVALKNSHFTNERTRRSLSRGGVIYVAANVSLSISNSTFIGKCITGRDHDAKPFFSMKNNEMRIA